MSRRRLVAVLSALAVSSVVLQAGVQSAAEAVSWKRVGSGSTSTCCGGVLGAKRRVKTATPSPSPAPTPTTTDTTLPGPSAQLAAPTPSSGTLWGLHQDLTWDGHASRRAIATTVAAGLGTQVSRNSLLWSQVERCAVSATGAAWTPC